MIDKMKQTLLQKQLIQKNDKIVVAVSGGPDSIAMLHALWQLSKELDLTLYVCHLNHMFRGEASAGDAEYVKAFSQSLNIEPYIFSEDIEAFSKRMKMSFEEAAREARYRLFNYVLQQTGATKIAVGQNMNDQAETLLMRLFRGSGLEGLTSIKFKRDHIIRPLLNIERYEIEAYCEEHHLKTRQDHTNTESIYTRNKIRLELIPYIQEHFNERVINRLYDTSQLLVSDLDFIMNSVNEAFEEYVLKGRYLKIKLERFELLHNAIQSRLIRKMIHYFLGDLKGISYQHISDVMTLIDSKRHGSCVIIRELIQLEISYDALLVYRLDQEKGLEKVVFEVGDVFPFLGKTFRALPLPYSDRGKHTITIDMGKIKGQLNLRTRQEGDRFIPLGLNGSKKLSDFFINEKIPSLERDDVLLLCDDDVIIWVVGYRMSEAYKIDSNTIERLTFVYETHDE